MMANSHMKTQSLPYWELIKLNENGTFHSRVNTLTSLVAAKVAAQMELLNNPLAWLSIIHIDENNVAEPVVGQVQLEGIHEP